MSLNDEETLYLEGAEDFDLVSGQSVDTVQLKEVQGSITLRSPDVIDAISNYFAHKKRNPNRSIRFRFVTISTIGKEKGAPFGDGVRGLELWEAARQSTDKSTREKHARLIADFLMKEGKLSRLARSFIANASDTRLIHDMIEPIEWDTDVAEVPEVVREIKRRLVSLGMPLGVAPEIAERVADHLYQEANTVATRAKERSLTKDQLNRSFSQNTTISMPAAAANAFLAVVPALIEMAGVQNFGPLPTTAVSARRFTKLPPSSPPRYFNRAEVLSDIDRRLGKHQALAINGSTGVGKSVIAAGFTLRSLQRWGWVDLRGLNAKGVRDTLMQVETEFAEEAGLRNLVLDDIEFPADARPLETPLGNIMASITARSGRLIITSTSPVPQRLSLALSMTGDGNLSIPRFTREEIRKYLIDCGCEAGERSEVWAAFVELHTSGHAQLVHSRVARLQAGGFPAPNADDLMISPAEVVEARAEARRLLTNLTEAERELTYRLSLTTGPLTRAQILAIANQKLAIREPGLALDVLIGPWIETLSDGLFRISPLLVGVGKDVLGDVWAQETHQKIARARLSFRTLTHYDVSSVLYHAIMAQDWASVAHISLAMVGTDEAVLKALAEDAKWFLLVGTGGATAPAVNEASLFLIRFLQFRLAAAAGNSEAALNIIERFEQELPSSTTEHLLKISRYLFLSQILIATDISIPIGKAVAISIEQIGLSHSLKEDLAVARLDRLERYLKGPSGEIEVSNLAGFTLSGRVTDRSTLDQMMTLARGLDRHLARRLLWRIGSDFATAFYMLRRVWMTEFEALQPDWNACLEQFQRVYSFARDLDLLGLAQASAAEIARILDENINDKPSALAAADGFAKEISWSPGQEDGKARILLRDGRNLDALSIWRRVLPDWEINPDFEIELSFSHRNAAVAAGQLGEWSECAEWLHGASRLAHSIVRPTYRAGLVIDEGFSRWKCGDDAGALACLRDGLVAIDSLPADDAGLQYYTLRKRAGHTLMWIAEESSGGPPEGFKEPPPACCSNLEDAPDNKAPSTPTDFMWVHLTKFELARGLGDQGLIDREKRLKSSTFGPSRFLFNHLRFQQRLKSGSLADFPSVVGDWAEAVELTKIYYREGGLSASSPLPASAADFDRSNLNAEWLLSGMLCGLFQVGAGRAIDSAFVEAWRSDANSAHLSSNLGPWLDLVEALFVTNAADASEILWGASSEWAIRVTASLKLGLDTSTSPSELLSVHNFWLDAVASSLIAKHALEEMVAVLARGWLEKAEQPFLLRAPAVTAPQIRNACNSASTGWRKMGEILLAACDAVPATVPPELRTRFRELGS